ncbi:MAG: alkaline phosphatase family protein [Gemmatimonadaceae bacterium]
MLALGCSPPPRATQFDPPATSTLLPTGVRLDPAGSVTDLGSFPLAMVLAPEGDRLVVILNGWREQGIQVIDRETGRVLQTLIQPAACLGLAFAPDGRTLYASGGNQDAVYRYDWANRAATLRDSIRLVASSHPTTGGSRYPAGIALSPDGRTLYVAENLGDSLAVVDVARGIVTQRVAVGRYPYGVAVAIDGSVYVTGWGDRTVGTFAPRAGGQLVSTGRISVSRHPSSIVMNADGSRLFVASGSTDRVSVVDTKTRSVIVEINDPPPGHAKEGSTPDALALSRDGRRLYVAEADNNAVAIVDLSPATSGVAGATGGDSVVGRIPTGWYPSALLALGDTLLVVNAKGRGTGANLDGPTPFTENRQAPHGYTLGQLSGTLSTLTVARAAPTDLLMFSARVAAANHWGERREKGHYPAIEHVVYVVKENRTFDQILGDVASADGDSTLTLFPRATTPNHHALAERFGTYDRFFASGEVSADGHNWVTAAYVTDFVEKTFQQYYSQRGRTYDFEGTNRDQVVDDDAAEPAAGYLWDLARHKGLTFRTYGEFVLPEGRLHRTEQASGEATVETDTYRGVKPFLEANVSHEYPDFDTKIKDQRRADVWIREHQEFARRGAMPALEIVRLPNDHTAGARRGDHTPRAMVADNDLALGRIIEALSHSPFWKTTAVFVVEDDAQNGPDHVDSHRSLLYLISPYAKPGVHHRFVNTTDVVATIEEILGLGTLSQFDQFGRSLRDMFTDEPDVRPYTALVPSVNLDDVNSSRGTAARLSRTLDLRAADRADEETLSRVVWMAVKGETVPFPSPRPIAATKSAAIRR